MTSEDNILILPVVTTHDLNPDMVLRDLSKIDIDTIVSMGFTNEGEFYFKSNRSDAGTVIFLLETAKKKLLDICEEGGITK